MATISKNGMNQGDLVTFLTNTVTLVNELKVDLDAARADLIALRASVVGITAQLDADAGVTDTTYASGNDPAALTVTAIAASDISLTV